MLNISKHYKKNRKVKLRYSTRKLSIGMVSVMIGFSIFLGISSSTSQFTLISTSLAAEPVDRTSPVEKAEPVEKEPVDRISPVEKTEPVEKAEPVEKTEPVEKAEPVEKKPVDRISPVEKAEPLDKTEPAEKAEPVEKKPVDIISPVEKAEPVEKTEPVEKAEPVEKTEPVEKAEPMDKIVQDARLDGVDPVDNDENSKENLDKEKLKQLEKEKLKLLKEHTKNLLDDVSDKAIDLNPDKRDIIEKIKDEAKDSIKNLTQEQLINGIVNHAIGKIKAIGKSLEELKNFSKKNIQDYINSVKENRKDIAEEVQLKADKIKEKIDNAKTYEEVLEYDENFLSIIFPEKEDKRKNDNVGKEATGDNSKKQVVGKEATEDNSKKPTVDNGRKETTVKKPDKVDVFEKNKKDTADKTKVVEEKAKKPYTEEKKNKSNKRIPNASYNNEEKVQKNKKDNELIDKRLLEQNLEQSKAKDNVNYNNTVTSSIYRIGGVDRVDTSVKISRKYYSNGANTVILVNGDRFTDILSCMPYSKLINAPILYTNTYKTPNEIMKELKRLKTKKIVIVGGFNAISYNQANKLRRLNYKIDRINGIDRYETSVKLANRIRRISGSKDVVIASGNTYSDALSISPLALKNNIPILLSEKSYIPKHTKGLLKRYGNGKIYISGGTESISRKVENNLKYYSKKGVSRFGGVNRYDTSAVIAKSLLPNSQTCIFTSGMNYADAFLMTPVISRYSAPILLLERYEIPRPTINYIKKSNIDKSIFIGGDNVIPNELIDMVSRLEKTNTSY